MNVRAHWRQTFDAIAEELCGALERNELISRFAQKEIDTPDGPANYGSVLANFEHSDDNARRKLAKHLLRIITQESLSLTAALAAVDVAGHA